MPLLLYQAGGSEADVIQVEEPIPRAGPLLYPLELKKKKKRLFVSLFFIVFSHGEMDLMEFLAEAFVSVPPASTMKDKKHFIEILLHLPWWGSGRKSI